MMSRRLLPMEIINGQGYARAAVCQMQSLTLRVTFQPLPPAESTEWLCFLIFEYFSQLVQGIPCSRKTSVGGHLKYGLKYLPHLNSIV